MNVHSFMQPLFKVASQQQFLNDISADELDKIVKLRAGTEKWDPVKVTADFLSTEIQDITKLQNRKHEYTALVIIMRSVIFLQKTPNFNIWFQQDFFRFYPKYWAFSNREKKMVESRLQPELQRANG